MFTLNNRHIQSLLTLLRAHGETFIIGGFLRDEILGIPAGDVDLKTNISRENLKLLFPYAKERETINGLTVLNFKKNNFDIEILSLKENLNDLNAFGDLTINSLFYDGSQIIDKVNGLQDFEEQVLRPADYLLYTQNFLSSPPIFLKTLRLASTTGFVSTPQLVELLADNLAIINSTSDSIITAEGYKILEGKRTLCSLELQSKIGLISNFNKAEANEFPLVKKRSNLHLYLCFYAYQTSYETIFDFITVFKFPKLVIEKFKELYLVLQNNGVITNYKLLNEKMLIERMLKNKP